MTFQVDGKTYTVATLGVLAEGERRCASFTINDGRTVDWRWLGSGDGRAVRIALEAAVAEASRG